MTPLRVVIADDEPIARRRLRRLLGERGDCELVGEFADGVALAAGLRHLRADVILLDVEMPGRNGFASLAVLAAPTPLVVFVTAFDGFAKQAFDVDATDYLLKPVSAARLDEAFARVARRRQARAGTGAPTATSDTARFVVQGRIYLFDRTKVLSVQALGNYVELATDSQRIQLRITLAAAHAELGPDRFVRVHRSWVIRRGAIVRVTSLPGSRYEITLVDRRQIPGGRAFSGALGRSIRS
jgi:two-component system LytT family response regulator